MKINQFIDLINKWQIQEKDILEKKSNDYAGANADCLSNFRKTAAMCDLIPEKVFEVMLCIKICRLVELSKGKVVQNESTEDTLLDLSNYAKLYRAYLVEKQQDGRAG